MGSFVRRWFKGSRSSPPVPIGTLGAGPDTVTVHGRIVAEGAIEAPSGAQCVLFRTKISRPVPRPGHEGAGPRWAEVAFAAESAQFWIEDDTGRIQVDFDLAADDIGFGLTERVCDPSELTAGEGALFAQEREPGPGEIALSRIAVDDSVRVQERLLMPGQVVVATGMAVQTDDGSLAVSASGKRALALSTLAADGS